MAKSKETFNKKAKEQKKQKERREKAEKMEERRANAKKGQSLEDMMAYVDENGNLSSTPPPQGVRRREVNLEDIQISVPTGTKRDDTHTGVVQFFNEEKGFGFIMDDESKERIFFHNSALTEPVKLNQRLKYEVQSGERGWVAVNIDSKLS